VNVRVITQARNTRADASKASTGARRMSAKVQAGASSAQAKPAPHPAVDGKFGLWTLVSTFAGRQVFFCFS